jgi:hypothetical protein
LDILPRLFPLDILDIEYFAFHLDIGYSPAKRDPAGRDGLLDIEIRLLRWILDIPCWILDIEIRLLR